MEFLFGFAIRGFALCSPCKMKTKICTVSNQEFVITDEDEKFYEKMGVPEPTLCPQERNRRRTSYRNFKNLYRRKCDGTGKMVISMYHKDQPFPVYENSYWWSDKWDSMEYGQEIDLGRSFLDQYHDLAMKVPRFCTNTLASENCEYGNQVIYSKDCYLVFGCVHDEDCMYGHIVWYSKNCLDNLYVFRCEWCSECVDCVDCYDLHHSTECANCNESYFLHDCRGCNNCFGCTNLRNKSYCFLNQQLTKEAYELKMQSLRAFKRETIEMGKEWLEKTKKKHCLFPPMFGVKNEDCTGNHVYESKNCQSVFDTKNCEDSNYLFTSFGVYNSYDISFNGGEGRFCYECMTNGGAEDCMSSQSCYDCSGMYYCEFCYNCKDCFGCTGLRNKQYCILNKQYEKEEYERLRDEIIERMKEDKEWGEFFSSKYSPFAYNESVAQEYQPLDQDEVISRGLRWRAEEVGASYEGEKVKIPDTIVEVDDEIIKQVLTCQVTGKSYRILKQELEFYKRMKLPLPDTCPDYRHEARMGLRNPRDLWSRSCKKCDKNVESSFETSCPEQVVCESCYLDSLG